MAKNYKTPSLGYPGGKSKIAKTIIEKMPPHTKYVEPFAGAAHVFFKKPKAEKNVLNDSNKNLIRFFKEVKGKKVCCNVGPDKQKFQRIENKPSSKRTVCEQVYLNSNCYGSKRSFEDKTSGYAYIKRKMEKEKCIDGSKLKGVRLTSQDFKKTIKTHDSKDTLFYVDPPYVEANRKRCLYGKDKCEVTPQEVANAVRNIKGKAIISYDNHPEVRKAFKGFKINKITLPYSLVKNDGTIKGKKQELLISNFKCKIKKGEKECTNL